MIPISDPDVHRRTTPYVNIGLIALNALVFAYELLFLSGLARDVFFYEFGLIPLELARGVDFTPVLVDDRGRILATVTSPITAWGTVFTSMFIHGGILHFAGNMVFLWVFGDNIEDRMGHVKYLLFYLGAGIAAAWTQVAINMDSQIPTIGASGAIAGVLGAYLLMFPYSRITTLVIFYFITAVRVPAVLVLGFWAFLQLFNGVGSLGAMQSGGVAYWAHLGGFAAGVLAVALYRLIRREPVWPRRRRWPYPVDDRW